METESMRAFVAVAECGSFSLAAEQIYLTQSAVSKRIATLESQTDTRLFDRIGRRITLTEAGRLLLPRAQEILGLFEDTQRALTSLSGTVRGRLSLATSHHIGLHRLPSILRRYTQRWPQVTLDMRFLDSEQAYQGVLDGSLELALVATPLWMDQLRFVCAPDHPLAHQPSLTLESLSRVDAVLPGEQTFTRAMVMNAFQRVGLDVSVVMSTNYLETLKMMVSIGLGWSVLPETLLDESVHTLKIDHPPIERPLGYLFHENRTLSNAARAMIDLLETSRHVSAGPDS